jgi:hypothetical protein
MGIGGLHHRSGRVEAGRRGRLGQSEVKVSIAGREFSAAAAAATSGLSTAEGASRTQFSPMKPLTKSQFKLGLECLQKLRHYRDGLPSNLADNSLLRLLSEGGWAVEALQRAVEPPSWTGPDGGAAVAPESFDEVRRSVAEVRRGGGCRSLYEVTIVHGDFLARLDLLRIRRDRLELVEIKSKSVEDDPLAEILTKNGGSVRSGWVPYLQDLAFQTELLRRWLGQHGKELGLEPEVPVVPKLILVKKDGVATTADCLENFRTRYAEFRGQVRAEVSYHGPGVRATDLLREVDATPAVALMAAHAQADAAGFGGLGVAACMDRLVEIVRTGRWPEARHSLSAGCRRCEYRVNAPGGSGVVRCWGGDVDAVPHHILKLARLTDRQLHWALGENAPLAAKLSELPETELQDRQKGQWRCANDGRDAVSAELRGDPYGVLRAPAEGAVYFLDFETARYPVPYRAGGRVNEMIPFQFEGHLLPGRASALSERELLPGFLELTDPDPRRGLVRALREQFGEAGPIYHWSSYERTVLKTLAEDLRRDPEPRPGDGELIAVCEALMTRLVDLCEITRQHLVLRETDGSYSIKRVLPVIWSDPGLRRAFARGSAPRDSNHYDDDTDPYQSLPGLSREFLEGIGPEAVAALADEEEQGEAITNGGLAMIYYHYVRLFGGGGRPEIRLQFRQYCQLDSAAMVMAYDWLRRRS